MRTHTSAFKQAISTYGREIDNKIYYVVNNETKYIDNLLSININTYSNLLKTVMKEINFESKKKLDKDTTINYQFGLKINNSYEYLDYGDFIVKENDWNADTNSYKHVCYDKMLYTMIDYNGNNITYPITVRNYINTIATKCGLTFANNNDTFVNYDKLINEDHFNNGMYTFRDVLDYLAEIIAGWFIIDNNGQLALKYPTETNETFNKDFLKDTNITFKSKYGAVNSVVFTRGVGSDSIYRKDDNDINTNGLHELKIENNPFLEGNDRENFIDGVYNKLHGLEFYVMDVWSTGIGYLEVGDIYTFEMSEAQAIKSGITKSGLFKAQSNNSGKVKCILLNDEMDLTSGLIETIYADEPSESITNYKISAPTDNSIKNAIITTNKNAGEIVLKANSDGKIVQVELKGNADNGSVFNVDADNINLSANDVLNILAGNEINLTTKNLNINSDNFSVDSEGNATMSNATITGGSINLSSDETIPKFTIKNSNYNDRYTEYTPNNIRMWHNGIANVQLQNLLNAAGFVAWDYADTDKQVQVNSWFMRITNGINTTTIEPSGITTPTVTQTSLEQQKKNFEKLDNALDIIKNIDIYKYNMKNDEDTDKKHIGFVIGDKFNYSKEVTSKNNDGVDIYSFVSVCCKAIQEQQEQINKLEERIKRLESEK